jgi:hypothetical protein
VVCERCGTIYCWDEADVASLGGSRKRYCSKTCKDKTNSSKKISDEDHEVHRKARQLEACQARGKKPYTSIVIARNVATRLFVQYGWTLYPYQCVCGNWHLTSQVQEVQPEYEWFRVFEGESPAFRDWLAREAASRS